MTLYKNNNLAMHRNHLRLADALNLFFAAKVARSVQKRRVIRTCLWSGIFYWSFSNIRMMKSIADHTLAAIHLREDGEWVDITFADESVATVHVTKIHRPS